MYNRNFRFLLNDENLKLRNIAVRAVEQGILHIKEDNRTVVWKDKKKEKYNENKDFIKAKNLYHYYVKKEKVDSFKEKHEDKFNLLKERNLIQ